MITILDVIGQTLLIFLISALFIPFVIYWIYYLMEKIPSEIMTPKRLRTVQVILTILSILLVALTTLSECTEMISEHKTSVYEMKTDTILSYNKNYPEYTNLKNRSNVTIRFYHESSFDGNHASYNFIDVPPSKNVTMDHYTSDDVISKSPLEDNFNGTKVIEDVSGVHIWNKGNDTIIAKDDCNDEITRALPSMFSEWKRKIEHRRNDSD